MFDEDNIRCCRGEYSCSLADLIELGGEIGLVNFLKTDKDTGLKNNDFERIKREYGENVFREMKLTSLRQSVIVMLRDLNLQFLLIAATVATVLEMT